MKIVCDACQAKYSISDDKVQGKVFKIRCKKCSNIIVVRGGAGAAEPAPPPAQEKETRVYDYGYDGGGGGDDAVWHVVINQDQVGPMTAGEVQQRFSTGEIDAETYIWREGFADWMPINQVDQFAAVLSSGGRTASAGRGAGAAAVSSMFGGLDDAGTMRSDPSDLFAAASSAAHHPDDDGGDLFGTKPAAAQQAAVNKLRGERNENSVLFSLNNLAQLASDRPAPMPSSSGGGGAAPGHATGMAGGEGSGLIDIRSMANAYLGSAGAAKPASAGIGSIDDLPVFGGGGFSEPAVIVPSAMRGGNSKLLYALIGSVGLLAVAAVILIVVLMKGDKPVATQVASASPDKAGSDTTSKEPDKAGSDTTTPAPSTGSGSGSSVAEAPTTPTTPDSKADTKSDGKKPTTGIKKEPRPGGQVARTETTKTVARDPVVKSPPPDTSGGCDEVSCVLNNYEGACCNKFRKGGAAKPPTGGATTPVKSGGSDLPESLDRAMISEGVAKVKAKVTACGERSSAKGDVKVSVKVNPDGSIASVTVKTTPDQGLGSCVATAMQKATFRKTQSGGSFAYPWKF